MRTFSVVTLGCRVNQYESEQLAAVLRAQGLTQVEQGGDVRVVNTCSVTTSAAKKSRHATRSAGRPTATQSPLSPLAGSQQNRTALPVLTNPDSNATSRGLPTEEQNARVIVAGCWATSHPDDAKKLPNVDLVLTHHDDVAEKLNNWLTLERTRSALAKPAPLAKPALAGGGRLKPVGATALPLLDAPQSSHQRAYLKIQDGCDAHCTYCIIPKLRPVPWSKPIADVVDEARRLVSAGHNELVLTGVFLGAYGHQTALRRRQADSDQTLARLVEVLATDVPQLSRLRLSSLEPGDLTTGLVRALCDSPQFVPHFHLPLQSGSEKILRRMNRQYTRADYIDLITRVNDSFDRPAVTTDIITAFPGETEADFEDTLDVARRAKFVHVHAFPYSARPGTAAARWTDQHVPPAIASRRIATLTDLAALHDLSFRESFVGENLEVLVERDDATGLRHGKSARHFDVHFAAPPVPPGTIVNLRVTHVSEGRTIGDYLASGLPAGTTGVQIRSA